MLLKSLFIQCHTSGEYTYELYDHPLYRIPTLPAVPCVGYTTMTMLYISGCYINCKFNEMLEWFYNPGAAAAAKPRKLGSPQPYCGYTEEE